MPKVGLSENKLKIIQQQNILFEKFTHSQKLRTRKLKHKDKPKKIDESSTFSRKIIFYVKQYLKRASLHGVQYLGENRTIIEYVWWSVIIILSLVGFFYMVDDIFAKVVINPIFISFATNNRHIYDIPFPALTICPVNKIKSSVFNFTEYLLRNDREINFKNETERKYANYMNVLCQEDNMKLHDQSRFDEFLNTTDFFSFLKTNGVNVYLEDGVIQGKYNITMEDFKTTFTQYGLCHTFNRLQFEDIFRDTVINNEIPEENNFYKLSWTQESGYDQVKDMVAFVDSFPFRCLVKGKYGGISIFLVENETRFEPACSETPMGFRLLLHNPSSIPSVNHDDILLPANYRIVLPLEASIIETSEKVKQYKPSQSDCYFSNERSLKYFKIYNQENCEIECATNATLEKCNCVQFFMPRENGTAICGGSRIKCYRDAWYTLVLETIKNQEFGSDMKGTGQHTHPTSTCNCLPLCTDATYQISVRQKLLTDLQLKKFFERYNGADEDRYHIANLVIYFKDDRVHTRVRNELYGISEFVSNCGGLLSLFTGFSLLSVVELIYFLSLRIIALGCILMVRNMLLEVDKYPVIISFATKDRYIHQIPFPAVTVCPVTQIKTDLFNSTNFINQNGEKFRSIDERMKTYLNYMEILCKKYDQVKKYDLSDYKAFLDSEDFFSFLQNNKVELSSAGGAFLFSKLGSQHFRPTVTQYGLCYTFNRRKFNKIFADIVINDLEKNAEEGEEETDYKKAESVDDFVRSYPLRSLVKGRMNGFRIIIADTESSLEHDCSGEDMGFRILLHSPSSMPSINSDDIHMPVGYHISIPITASIIESSERLRYFSPYKRDCYFPFERSLKYYKIYNLDNCELECIANVTLKNCNCVLFFMPRENGTKVCGVSRLYCAEDAWFSLVIDRIRIEKNRHMQRLRGNLYELSDCKCLPLCDDIKYLPAPRNTKYQDVQLKSIRDKYFGGNVTIKHMSVIWVYFKDARMNSRIRNPILGLAQFISNFGSLLSLFTGFSLLSIVEVIYFLTLRIVGNIRLFGNWYGKIEF